MTLGELRQLYREGGKTNRQMLSIIRFCEKKGLPDNTTITKRGGLVDGQGRPLWNIRGCLPIKTSWLPCNNRKHRAAQLKRQIDEGQGPFNEKYLLRHGGEDVVRHQREKLGTGRH